MNFLWMASNLLATEEGMGKSERRYVGILERTLLLKNPHEPPLERYLVF